VFTPRPHLGTSLVAARHSLRVRLPLLISAILAAVVSTFLWAAYREVHATLVQAGGERARSVANQVANLIEQSSRAEVETLRRVAADADVRRYLRNPTDDTRGAARARLAPLTTNGPRRIGLWSAAGLRLLDISIPAATIPGAVPVVLPAVTRPPAAGLNALQTVDNVVFTDYSRRVTAARPDEVGRLGLAFNAMVAEIRDKHHQLETHAFEQCASLEALRKSEGERAQLLVREREARAQAEAANRLKDQFLATLSHELRTPLNAILGYARMLRTSAFPAAKRDRAIEIIERNAWAQNQLVEDLLDMSRITIGKMLLVTAPVSIAVPLREAVDSIRPAAEAKQIALDLDIDPLAGIVRADATRLQQVFWNLLSNAVKFTTEGGSVSVTLGRDGGTFTTIISNTGIGIAPEFLPHVFDLFRQADGGFSRQHGGLGLGLAICKQLVELHGGTIRAASDGPGRGATFTVLLLVTAAISG